MPRFTPSVRSLAVLCVAVIGLALSPAPAAQAPNQAVVREKIIRYIRQRFNIPDSVKITSTDLRQSAYADFYETTLTLDDGKDKRTQPLFVSKDERYVIQGDIFTLGGDPRQDILRLISLEDPPDQGPANAPVTLVEYSDLQCPMCARLHEMLETDVIPKYGDKLRVVFKEFPLTNIHDWALSGAIASACVYQIDPYKFATFRSLVFKNQEAFDANKARDLLLHYGAEAGVDNLKLASCLDSRASLPKVEANMREGEALGIASTPTSFINGRVFVGVTPEDLYKLIDEALKESK